MTTCSSGWSTTWDYCLGYAGDQGLYVTWEFEPGFAFNKPSDIQRVLDKLPHDNFGVLYDTCHGQMVSVVGARHEGRPETLAGGQLELIRRLSGRINHIHLIDSDNCCHKAADGSDETWPTRPSARACSTSTRWSRPSRRSRSATPGGRSTCASGRTPGRRPPSARPHSTRSNRSTGDRHAARLQPPALDHPRHRRALPPVRRAEEAGYDGVEMPIFEGDPEHFARIGRVLETRASLHRRHRPARRGAQRHQRRPGRAAGRGRAAPLGLRLPQGRRRRGAGRALSSAARRVHRRAADRRPSARIWSRSARRPPLRAGSRPQAVARGRSTGSSAMP